MKEERRNRKERRRKRQGGDAFPRAEKESGGEQNDDKWKLGSGSQEIG